MGELHLLLQSEPSPHPHAGGVEEDEAHRGRVLLPGNRGVIKEDGEKVAATPTSVLWLPQAPRPQLYGGGGHGGGYASRNAARGFSPGNMGVIKEDWEEAAATPINIPYLPQTQAPSPQLDSGGGHRVRYASRNAPPVPPRHGPLDYYPRKYCYCNLDAYKLISWEYGNEARRYYTCRYKGMPGDCKYREWIDPHYTSFLRTLLLDICDKLQTLEREIADEKKINYNLRGIVKKTEMEALKIVKKTEREKLEIEKKTERELEAMRALLSARTRIFGGIIFVIAGVVFCGKCCKTIDS